MRTKKKKEGEKDEDEEEEEESKGEEEKTIDIWKLKKPEEMNRQIYKNGVRTDTPKPSKKDTRVDGAFTFFLCVFAGWPQNHQKSSVFRARPEEHPRNAQFIKIHKNPRRGLSWWQCEALTPLFLQCWGRQKWGYSPSNCQQWGSITHP